MSSIQPVATQKPIPPTDGTPPPFASKCITVERRVTDEIKKLVDGILANARKIDTRRPTSFTTTSPAGKDTRYDIAHAKNGTVVIQCIGGDPRDMPQTITIPGYGNASVDHTAFPDVTLAKIDTLKRVLVRAKDTLDPPPPSHCK